MRFKGETMHKITHHRKPLRIMTAGVLDGPLEFELPDGATAVSIAIVGDAYNRQCVAEIYADPAPIPMGEMRPRDIGMITGSHPWSGKWFQRKKPSGFTEIGGGMLFTSAADGDAVVRLLQPGESLVIERVGDEPEEPPKADWTPPPKVAGDGDFERLPDGTRKGCINCDDGEKRPCPLNLDDECITPDARGSCGNAHAKWHNELHDTLVSKHKTLGEALRTGTAEEIVAALSCVDLETTYGWDQLSEAVRGKSDALDCVIDAISGGVQPYQTDRDCLAKLIVALRDPLGLF
jgi:hypothetical protein